MRKRFSVVAGSLIAAALFVGCSSSMVSKSTQHTDSGITDMIEASLKASDKVDAGQIQVQTREGNVYLNGVVDTEAARLEAGRVAWRTEGVTALDNNLTVGERTVGSWIDDVTISSTVKTKLISNSEINSSNIDVSSSQGVVTLIGRVSTQTVSSDAERIARDTKGVKGVNNELLVGKIR